MDYNGGTSKKRFIEDPIIPDNIVMSIKTEPEVLIEHAEPDIATCEKKIDALRDLMEQRLYHIQAQLNIIMETQEEQSLLLRNFVASQQDLNSHFPLKTTEELEELNELIIPENRDKYINTFRTLLRPQGVKKNLSYLLSTEIINEYNIDGVHGKKSLKDLKNFYNVLIDSIEVTENSGAADQQLRDAIRLAKKRYLKSKCVARPRAVASKNSPKPKRKRLEWNEGSEVALLDLWPERLEELRGQRKNGHIYAEIAYNLSKLGYAYSSREVQVKLQNFTQRYRKEKVAMGVSGGSPSTWPHYARVHQIIGGFKANMLTELTLKRIDDPSIASSSSSRPSTPLLAPSSPLAFVSPSPAPSTAASALEPVKKKRVSNFQATILQKFENLSTDITEHIKKTEENEKELIEIEKKKADSLEKNVKDSEELNNALISFLNKN